MLPDVAENCSCSLASGLGAPSLMRDPMTGLFNKHGLVTQGNELLPQLAAAGRRPQVIFLELNDYDALASRFGFQEILTLLTQVRELMVRSFRDSLVARFDSERFAVLADDEGEGLRRFLDALKQPMIVGGVALHLSVSCGIAIYPDSADNMDMLIMAARAARKEALNTGKPVAVFARDLRHRLRRRRAIEDALWDCRDGQHMRLLYQPKMTIHDGSLMGVEALLRWDHPELGTVSPAEFIPIAEQAGSILPIGNWVIREALHQKREWQRAGHDIALAINVSPLQLSADDQDRGVLSTLLSEIGRFDFDPTGIELEITEGLLTDADIMRQVQRVADAGFGIAVDDFGRDHSALSLLVDCPARTLKIDRSFVDNVASNDRQLAIVRFIVDLARSLGMRTVVEGVEHMQQLIRLADAGCDYGQGYFYYRPMAAAEVPSVRHMV